MKKQLLKTEWRTKTWRTKTCQVGASCWCRIIETIDGETVIDEGDIRKDIARHIVNVHNFWIEVKKIHKK